VLRDGQYSTQPLEWIIHEEEKATQCKLMIELQPGQSPGFLRPCGKEENDLNLLIIENCPSDWTDHETSQKCKAYAFYSKRALNVSNKKYGYNSLLNPLRQHNTTVMNVKAIILADFCTLLCC
jgi:hypothetical protein